MAASYPSAVRPFPVRQDVSEVIFAEHVNTLQDELSAVQTYLGLMPHVSTTPNPAGTFVSVSSIFDSMAARLANIETGVVADVHSQYLHLKGGDTVLPSAADVRGVTVRARADQTAALLRAENSGGTDFFLEVTTGGVAVKGALTVNGSAVLDLASNQFISGIKQFNARPVMAAGITMGSAQTVSFTPTAATAAATTQPSGQVVLPTAYWNGTSSVTTDTATIQAVRGSTTAGDLYVDISRPVRTSTYTATSQKGFVLTGAAGTTRDIALQTAGVDRWLMRLAANAESGSAAGSDLHFVSRNDDGSFRATPLSIERSTGFVSAGIRLLENGQRVYSANNPPPVAPQQLQSELDSYVKAGLTPFRATGRSYTTLPAQAGSVTFVDAPAAGFKRVVKGLVCHTRMKVGAKNTDVTEPLLSIVTATATQTLGRMGQMYMNQTVSFPHPLVLDSTMSLSISATGREVLSYWTAIYSDVPDSANGGDATVFAALLPTQIGHRFGSLAERTLFANDASKRVVTAVTLATDTTTPGAIGYVAVGTQRVATLALPQYGFVTLDLPIFLAANEALVVGSDFGTINAWATAARTVT